MDKLVIAGVDSVLGANLAATLSSRFNVVGLSFHSEVTIDGCETAPCDADDPQTIAGWVESEQPQWLVYCGPAAESTWNGRSNLPGEFQALQWARPWARAAAERDCAFTVISSDAVFTGPWMFHDEDATSFCQSRAAQTIRTIERELAEIYPRTLIARTNVFGWSPLPQLPNFVDRIVSGITTQGDRLDCVRHATPILATDLAEVLSLAYAAGLEGLYHMGGAERISPYRFGALLSTAFECVCPAPEQTTALVDRRNEFGAGETSLQSRRLRNALGISLPLIHEGIAKLQEQVRDGLLERIGADRSSIRELVA